MIDCKRMFYEEPLKMELSAPGRVKDVADALGVSNFGLSGEIGILAK